MRELWRLLKRCRSLVCIWDTVTGWIEGSRWSRDDAIDEAEGWLIDRGCSPVKDYWIFDLAVPDAWVGVFVDNVLDRYTQVNEASIRGWYVLIFPEQSTGEYIAREMQRAIHFELRRE